MDGLKLVFWWNTLLSCKKFYKKLQIKRINPLSSKQHFENELVVNPVTTLESEVALGNGDGWDPPVCNPLKCPEPPPVPASMLSWMYTVHLYEGRGPATSGASHCCWSTGWPAIATETSPRSLGSALLSGSAPCRLWNWYVLLSPFKLWIPND